MEKFKYVITQDNQVLMFDESIAHSEFKHRGIKSAGFVQFYYEDEVKAHCYGKSVSLRLSPSQEQLDKDSQTITRIIRGY